MGASEFAFWVGIAVVGVTVIGVCVVWAYAWSGSDQRMLDWRIAKVVSVLLGFVGLMLGILSFETALRELSRSSARHVSAEFLELKLYLTYTQAVACANASKSEELKKDCDDLSNLNRRYKAAMQFSSDQLPTPTSRYGSAKMRDVLSQASWHVDEINRAIGTANEPTILGSDNQAKAALLGLILIAVSLVLSLGEAIYQARREYKNAKISGAPQR